MASTELRVDVGLSTGSCFTRNMLLSEYVVALVLTGYDPGLEIGIIGMPAETRDKY